MVIDKYDTMEDANKGISEREAQGHEVVDVKIFNYTKIMQTTGMPVQFPIFYVVYNKKVLLK